MSYKNGELRTGNILLYYVYYLLIILRGDFLQTRVSSAQKSNESGSRLRNFGKVKMAGNFFIVRVFPGSIYKHNRCGLVPF